MSKPSFQQSSRLLQSTAVVSAMTLLSRILGFLRDMVIAYAFGASGAVDAFFVAFKIPNFMRRLFAEGAFSQAFVPVLSDYKAHDSQDTVKAFIDNMAGTLAVALAAVVVIAIITAPWLVYVFAPGYHDDPIQAAHVAQMLRITFPYLLFISLTAFCGAILNSYRSFAVPAFTPVLLNISLIAAAMGLRSYFTFPIVSLAWGVFIAGIAQLSFQVPFLWRKRLLPRPRIALHDPGVRRVLRLMVPALFGVSVAQLNLLVDTIFASFLPHGSITWLYFSDRLSSFPLGVIGVAIATVILPHLSQKHAQRSASDYAATLDWALRLLLLIGIPAATGLFVLAGPLLITLFQHGAYTARDVMMTRQSLWMFAIGVQAFMLIKVLAAGFYARQDIKTPVKVGVLAMISNIIFNCVLIHFLAHAGLALSTTLSAYINAATLAWILYRRGVLQFRPGWRLFLLRLVVANVFMMVLLWWLAPALSTWMAWDILHRTAWLLGLVGLAMLVYAASLWLCGMRYGELRLCS